MTDLLEFAKPLLMMLMFVSFVLIFLFIIALIMKLFS